MLYCVIVAETLEYPVYEEAESAKEAIAQVEDRYKAGRIILSAANHTDTTFTCKID